MLSLQDYAGREQSFLKHTILETYLERLFMIVGRTEVVINYVDCFAGPWADDNKELKDTSIGLSINLMKKCVATLRKNFNKSVTFRALYIEKDKQAFARLQDYVSKFRDPSVHVECRNGDYTMLKQAYNLLLANDGYEIVPKTKIGNRELYAARQIALSAELNLTSLKKRIFSSRRQLH